MRSTTAALFAFVASVLAQTSGFDAISKPAEGEAVPAGSTYDIVWDYSDKYTGTVTLSLLGGASASTLQVLSTIESGVDNSKGTYAWAVGQSLGDLATYGIKIAYDSDPTTFQYSFPFKISGSTSTSGSSSSSGSSSGSLTATITLSSVSQSSTALSTTSIPLDSSNTTLTSAAHTVTATGVASNLSTTASGGASQTTITTVTSSGSSSTASKTASASTVPSSGATSVGAGSLAALAGLAMAVLF